MDSDEYDDNVESTPENVDTTLPTKEDDGLEYIRVELPIVNVSGKLIPGETSEKKVYDIDDSFDLIYDVTPRPGLSYDTSIVPLVQFSAKKTTNALRQSNERESIYDNAHELKPFTPDERLLFSTAFLRRQKYKTYKYNINSRFTFKTSKSPLATYRRHSYIKTPIITPRHILTQPHNIFTRHGTHTKNTISVNKETQGNMSWEFIDDLLKSFSKTPMTTHTRLTGKTVYKNISNLFQNLLDLRHNSSVYLSPNLSVYYKDVPLYSSISRSAITTIKSAIDITSTKSNLLEKSLSSSIQEITSTDITNAFHAIKNSNTTKNTSSTTHSSYNLDKSIRNVSTSAATAQLMIGEISTSSLSASKRDENLTGSLVNRESWDNVVQVAPAMAVILHHLKENKNQTTQDLNVTSFRKRKKRYIESVPINNARPRNVTIKVDTATTASAHYGIADMQEFAQLVEIQDDELHGRVALRYLRRYVGPALLNICDYTQTNTRQVYLFNSSRIVLAISNFTMDTMTLIVTPARTVMTGDGRCPDDYLECQVSGARVCVDSLNACDGIPNCGSDEIYDEDRLACGAVVGLQHNVYLAAFTFLGVLLTTLYGIHYWLRRCVPKVSDAFFLYTDGIENVLYLDTIMRSPMDDDDVTKMVQETILDDDLLLFSEVNEGKKVNKFRRFFKSLFTCSLFRLKVKKRDAYEEMAQEGLFASLEEQKKRYSYAELELRKILNAERLQKDIAVQTGDSLEMSNLTNIRNMSKKQYEELHKQEITESLVVLNEYSSLGDINNENLPDELSILNFFNNSNSESTQSRSSDDTIKFKYLARNSITFEEKEIKSLTYDKAKKENTPTSSTYADANESAEGSLDRTKKHLRFEENTTTIPSGGYDEDSDDNSNENLNRRRSVVLGVGKSWRKRNLDSIHEDDENTGSSQGNSIRFWSKSKKTKK